MHVEILSDFVKQVNFHESLRSICFHLFALGYKSNGHDMQSIYYRWWLFLCMGTGDTNSHRKN